MAKLRVEVVHARRERQEVVSLELEEGSSAMDAVRASGLAQHPPGQSSLARLMGIFGKSVPPETRLRDGDRVELYRPLRLDPKVARREKAAGKKRRPR